jgi:trehalose 6-phosphate synthase/phosphatase
MALTIIVSNRLPVSVKKVNGKLEYAASDGGLATGLASYTKGRKSIWIGWPGIASDDLTEKDKKQITAELKNRGLMPVFMTKKQVDGFYSGYSNSVLWPLFHDLPLDIADADKYWKAYREVNEMYANTVATAAKPNSLIWVHDYQLLLLPELLRWTIDKSNTIGFFSHIPFPSHKNLEKLPQAKLILRGILGASLVGFHTAKYGKAFMDCCNKFGVGVAENNQIIMGTRTVKIADFPIGIDYDKFSRATRTWKVRRELLRLRNKYRKYRIILTVDRLDPSKGFVERLRAYDEFLKINPQLHGKVKMVMLTIPSRLDVMAYKILKDRIDELVTSINSNYGTVRWQPIDFMYKSVPFEELSALYQIADVAFVVPVRDGMNLVAKEYIASKQKRDGVLVLSQTAGAAQELTDAVLVNPKRRNSIVAGLTQALNMTHAPITSRLKSMQKTLAANTINTWANGFMNSMERTNKVAPHYTKTLNSHRQQLLLESYMAAQKRLILLDYDGTLVEFNIEPDKTPLQNDIRSYLKIIGDDLINKLVMVSGRPVFELERYIAGINADAAAEHGAFIRENNVWRTAIAAKPSWKTHILPFLERYAAKTPGARVEEKDYALVWHYRKSPPYQAQKYLTILRRVLRPELSMYGLKAYDGSKVLEIKPPSVNKGTAVRNWLTNKDDFILIIGDDYTDEDMFKAAPKNSYTIKLGLGITAANYRVKDTNAVRDLLKMLADSN